MNALPLCTYLVTSTLAVLTFTPREQSVAPAPQGEVTFVNSALPLRTDSHAGFEPAVAEFLDGSEGVRQSTLQDIDGYGLAAAAMVRRCGDARSYLQTRLQALREHVDYARAEAVKLPNSEGDPEFTSAHAHFHRTMTGLREAFAQALDELNDGV